MAIVLVVLLHASSWFDSQPLESFSVVVATLRMPVFFALSGMLAGKWAWASWQSLWSHKISLFLWTFAVWNVIGAISFLCVRAMRGWPITITVIARDILESWIWPKSELWFIWALAGFFVITKLVRAIPPVLVLGVAVAVSVVSTCWIDLGNVGWNGVFRYYVYFAVGLYYRDALLRWSKTTSWPWISACIGAWVAVSLLVAAFELRWVPGLYLSNCLLGLLAGVCVARVVASVPGGNWLGRRTLPIYVAHTPVILVLLLLTSALHVDLSTDWLAYVTPILVTVVAIAAALAIHGLSARGPLRLLYEPPNWLRLS